MKINDRVREFIKEYDMLAAGEKVVAGVSGGADSICLLFLLYEFSKEMNFTLSVVHVEHGIRGEESLRDAEYVTDVCRALNLPCRVVHIDAPSLAAQKGESLEEAARNARYEEFEKENADKIAIAHHACDTAETMLFNLFRGSSLWGLGSIAPVRGKIIRPLLCLTRDEIEGFCRERKIDFRTDASNFDIEIPRNAIRHEIMPVAIRINSNAVRHMENTAGDIREWGEYISSELDELEKIYIEDNDNEIRLNMRIFKEKPDIVISELVRRAIGKCAKRLKDISRIHVRDVMSLAGKSSGRKINLPYGVLVVREFDTLVFKRKAEKVDSNSKFEVNAPENGEIITPDGAQYTFKLDKIKNSTGFSVSSYTKWFDYDKIGCIPVLRTRRSGDYMTIRNGRKKLKDVLAEAHIGADKRGEIFMLASGSHVIWVPGVRMSEEFKIDDSTKRVWKVSIRSVR